MRTDTIMTLVFLGVAAAAFICLKAVQSMHAKDPHFAEEEERRKEEYRRRTAEKNQEKELEQALNEGYSYGGIDDEDEDGYDDSDDDGGEDSSFDD